MNSLMEALTARPATRRINRPNDDERPRMDLDMSSAALKAAGKALMRTPSMDAHAEDVAAMLQAARKVAADEGRPATAAEISRLTGIDERDAAGIVMLLDPATRGPVEFGEDGASVGTF